MQGYFAGLSLGFSLILAIGAQNAFVLRQGLKQQHVFLVFIICAVSDALLITAGVAGFASIIKQLPWLEPVARYGGVAFLAVYGAKSLWQAFKAPENLVASEEVVTSATKVAMMCLAFTWLNPHVYLDTVFLLGAISTQYPLQQVQFALGGVTASFIFFGALAYGARLLAPVFEKPTAWRVFDVIIALVMWLIALKLLLV
ncbi:LysE/ArgO family amino acid transporter [Pseudomonas sp. HK3]